MSCAVTLVELVFFLPRYVSAEESSNFVLTTVTLAHIKDIKERWGG